MKLLVGDTSSARMVRFIEALGWGRMVSSNAITPYPGEAWGFDNMAFTYWRQGLAFNDREYWNRLAAAEQRGVPYLAVTPDIVAAGLDSLRFSLSWRKRLPTHWPWYLAVQNGMTTADVEPHLPRFVGLFLGGNDEFKATAGEWCDFAHAHGKRFHYARAGTLEKIQQAYAVGSDSLDSSFPLWTVERTIEFARWWVELECRMLRGDTPRRTRREQSLSMTLS